MKDAQRPSPVLVQGVQSHQPTTHALVDRIESQPLLAVLDGRAIVPPLLQQANQTVEQALVKRDEPLALWNDPVVIGARQEVSLVQAGCVFQGGTLLSRIRSPVGRERVCDGTLEVVDVDEELGIWPERARVRADGQEPIRVRPRRRSWWRSWRRLFRA